MLCMVQSGSPWKKVNGKWSVVDPPQKKWISGKEKKLQQVLKKYNATKVEKEEKKEQAPEWVDNSFIKTYTDDTQMGNIFERIVSDHPNISKRQNICLETQKIGQNI